LLLLVLVTRLSMRL
ncbi:transporter, anaerobic C4-dicarboxylate uptake C family protein, partial [Vibrio parahaemolyticus V-223/04]